MIHDHQLFGIRAEKSSDLTIMNNVISWIRPDNLPEPPYLTWSTIVGGINVSECEPFLVKDNTVAATWHSGYQLPAKKCGDASVHTGNVAHSISGYGAIINKAGTVGCSEFTDFKGYKT